MQLHPNRPYYTTCRKRERERQKSDILSEVVGDFISWLHKTLIDTLPLFVDNCHSSQLTLPSRRHALHCQANFTKHSHATHQNYDVYNTVYNGQIFTTECFSAVSSIAASGMEMPSPTVFKSPQLDLGITWNKINS